MLPPKPRKAQKPRRIEPIAKPKTRSLLAQAVEADATFVPPEEAAAADVATANASDAAAEVAPAEPKVNTHETTKKHWWQFRLQRPRTKKQKLIWAAAILVILLTATTTTWALTRSGQTTVAKTTKKAAPKKVIAPKIIYSTLSGLPVPDASVNQRTITGVMIENSIDARPQSGLGEASVVFEAVAEGGVTRFLALFQDTAPANIGPVRSARPYYVSWALGFNAAYAHVGGSVDGLADITAWHVQDMNQFYNAGSFHRTTDRDAPHNVYTSIATLNQLEAAKGYSSSYTGLARKADQLYVAPAAATSTSTTTTTKTKPAPAADTRTVANSIDFALSGYTYDPHYDYVAATNSYNRSEAGEAHIDANTNKQISPRVVIAMVLPLVRGALDSSGAYYSNYTTTGTGQAYIFQDGTVTQGQWNKADNNAALTFTDSAGTPIPLDRGTTWISAVSGTGQVTYK